jgi:uncharacterized membrane protein
MDKLIRSSKQYVMVLCQCFIKFLSVNVLLLLKTLPNLEHLCYKMIAQVFLLIFLHLIKK